MKRAPDRSKTQDGLLLGFEMPSWFDLMSLDATGPEDEAGIKSASALVSFGFGLLPLSMYLGTDFGLLWMIWTPWTIFLWKLSMW